MVKNEKKSNLKMEDDFLPDINRVLRDISKAMEYLKKKSLKRKTFNVNTEKVRIQYLKTWVHACNSYLAGLKDV